MTRLLFGDIGPGLLFMALSTVALWSWLIYVAWQMACGWKMFWVRGDGWLHPRRLARQSRKRQCAGSGFWKRRWG